MRGYREDTWWFVLLLFLSVNGQPIVRCLRAADQGFSDMGTSRLPTRCLIGKEQS